MGRLKALLAWAGIIVAVIGSWSLFGYLESTQRLSVGGTLFATITIGYVLAFYALRLNPNRGAFSALFSAGLLLSLVAAAGYVNFSLSGREFIPVSLGSGWAVLHQAHFGYLAVLGLPILYATSVRWFGSLIEHELVLAEALAAE